MGKHHEHRALPGKTLRVLSLTRTSHDGPGDEAHDAQQTAIQRWVDEHIDTAVVWRHFHITDTGRHVDREIMVELMHLIESGQVDLVVTEDLSHIMRRHRALFFTEQCEDHGVRLVGINDHLDTAQQENWRMNTMFLACHPATDHYHTSLRIKRSLEHRFRQGHLLGQPIPFGYRADEGATHDDQITKDPACAEAVEHVFDMLETGAGYTQVAAWLNQQGHVPPTAPAWTGTMAKRWISNPILKGVRVYGRTTRRHMANGRTKLTSRPAEQVLQRPCPHLAYFTAEQYDNLMHMLNDRTKSCSA